MRTVQTLIDECVLLCGGQSALARKLGIHQPEVSAMQRGARPVSGATVGMLCDLLELDGEESRRLLALAIVGAAPPEKQGVLRRAFFVSWVTGATIGLVGLMTPGDARSMMVGALTNADARESGEVRNESKPELTKDMLSGDLFIHCRLLLACIGRACFSRRRTSSGAHRHHAPAKSRWLCVPIPCGA